MLLGQTLSQTLMLMLDYACIQRGRHLTQNVHSLFGHLISDIVGRIFSPMDVTQSI